jgi:hypothetical protein
MQTSLWGIARKAKQDKKYRFGNLYGLINKQALYIAWKEINRSAAAGIDKVTAKEFEKNLDSNLYRTQNIFYILLSQLLVEASYALPTVLVKYWIVIFANGILNFISYNQLIFSNLWNKYGNILN